MRVRRTSRWRLQETLGGEWHSGGRSGFETQADVISIYAARRPREGAGSEPGVDDCEGWREGPVEDPGD